MVIYKTPNPGTVELAGVGDNPSQAVYENAMSPANLKGASVVVASLTTGQPHGAKFLLKNGFQQIGPEKRNPNTGHMILLLVKFLRS